jgi:uncharacterized protein (TIRG00374 family)
MPRLRLTRRMVVLGLVFVAFVLAFLYFVLPQIAGLEDSWRRIEEGDPWWLGAAFVFTLAMFGAYVANFQGVYVRAGSPIDWRASYQITMASLAATRLFAAGGAGGVALTAWALRRSGMPARSVADSTVAFLVLQYLVYMAALVVAGFGLYFGVFDGNAPFAITVVPALFGLTAIAVFGSMALVPADFERRLRTWATGHGRVARLAARLAAVPSAVSSGVREAIHHLGSRDPALLGAFGYWLFQVAVLWASFHAFGAAPPPAVLVMGFFVGMLGNLLPLPGGVGGVDGGMIGAFVALGVPFGAAAVAVLTYRAFAFWLPTIPGVIAYLQLRRTVHRWQDRHYTS